MNISLKKTIAQIDRCLAEGSGASADQLHKIYDLTLRLQSQLLSVIYDMETFGGSAERVANVHSGGKNKDSVSARTSYRMSARNVITNIICCNFWALNKL